jgi:hypothetical protein
MEIVAKILRVEPTEQVTEKFQKRKLIVEYAENPTYPQTLEFTAVQKTTSILDGYNPGDDIKIFYNLKGRENAGKTDGKKYVFNTLEVWKLELVKKSIDFVENKESGSPKVYDENEELPF